MVSDSRPVTNIFLTIRTITSMSANSVARMNRPSSKVADEDEYEDRGRTQTAATVV